MIAKQSFGIDELVFSRHHGNLPYLNAFLMERWEQARQNFERYRLPVVQIRQSTLSTRPQDPDVIPQKAEEYLIRLNWLQEKFAEIQNSDIAYFLGLEIERAATIKYEAQLGMEHGKTLAEKL